MPQHEAGLGGSIAEAVVAGLFGLEPTFADLAKAPPPDSIELPGLGSLSNINIGPRSWANATDNAFRR
jgi:hypothetical protein